MYNCIIYKLIIKILEMIIPVPISPNKLVYITTTSINNYLINYYSIENYYKPIECELEKVIKIDIDIK